MSHRVCPWWIGYLLLSPIRRWQHDPEKILSPFVREGMTVLEPGPGMGFFTLPLARLAGASGRVVAIDLQLKMIQALKRRAARANVLDRIHARVTSADTLGIDDLTGKVDFTLAFAVVHELPDAARFFAEVSRASKPGAQLLLAEPKGHVDDAKFAPNCPLLPHHACSLRRHLRSTAVMPLCSSKPHNFFFSSHFWNKPMAFRGYVQSLATN